jgi:hypothetical protein
MQEILFDTKGHSQLVKVVDGDYKGKQGKLLTRNTGFRKLADKRNKGKVR